MPRSFIRASLAATLLLGACSQTAAPVELKGTGDYSRNTGSQNIFANNAASYGKLSPSSYTPPPVYTNVSAPTSQTASTQPIGVSDLAPPTKSESKPQPVKAPPAPQAANVNPWTGKPRVMEVKEKPLAAKVATKPVAAKASAKPERVIAKNKEAVHKPLAVVAAAQPAPTAFMWPVGSKKIISGFGPKGGGKANDGINIASAEGEPVWAAADGEVVYVGNELSGYGNMVIIKHASSKTTTYAHLNSAAIDKYDRVKQGDIIGYVGSTGNVKAPQLHFAIRNGKDPVDPQKFLSTKVAGL